MGIRSVAEIEKLLRDCPEARARYVFFAAPGFKHERQRILETASGIEVAIGISVTR